MNRFIARLSLVLLICACAAAAKAETVIAQDFGPYTWAASLGIGQTFVWPVRGRLDAARVVSDSSITATFKLYDGAHACDDTGGEFYSQEGITLLQDTYSTVGLSVPQALVNGATYTFCVYKVPRGRIVLHYTSLYSFYANGTYVSDGIIDPAGGGGDLQFELDAIPAPPTPAPALGPGLLALLSSLVLVIGALAMVEQER
jgi:hypothetical protein